MNNKPKKASKRDDDDPEQSKRFLEAARKHGADETEEGADQAFKKYMRLTKPKK